MAEQIKRWLLERSLFGKEYFKYKCPRCKVLLSSETNEHDQLEECPECKCTFRLPSLERLNRRREKQGFKTATNEPIEIFENDSTAIEWIDSELENKEEIKKSIQSNDVNRKQTQGATGRDSRFPEGSVSLESIPTKKKSNNTHGKHRHWLWRFLFDVNTLVSRSILDPAGASQFPITKPVSKTQLARLEDIRNNSHFGWGRTTADLVGRIIFNLIIIFTSFPAFLLLLLAVWGIVSSSYEINRVSNFSVLQEELKKSFDAPVEKKELGQANNVFNCPPVFERLIKKSTTVYQKTSDIRERLTGTTNYLHERGLSILKNMEKSVNDCKKAYEKNKADNRLENEYLQLLQESSNQMIFAVETMLGETSQLITEELEAFRSSRQQSLRLLGISIAIIISSLFAALVTVACSNAVMMLYDVGDGLLQSKK